jgi:hypothetical protein
MPKQKANYLEATLSPFAHTGIVEARLSNKRIRPIGRRLGALS